MIWELLDILLNHMGNEAQKMPRRSKAIHNEKVKKAVRAKKSKPPIDGPFNRISNEKRSNKVKRIDVLFSNQI